MIVPHKHKLLSVAGLILLVVLAWATISIHGPSQPRRNEQRIMELMKSARPTVQGCCVAGVALDNGVNLQPNKRQMIDGYMFELTTHGAEYDIVARPMQFGVTGFRLFSINEKGEIQSKVEASP